jgi:hypothetical protein
MDDIVAAVHKIHEHRHRLAMAAPGAGAAS